MAAPASDALFEHAPCGLLLTHADGRIVRANATFCGWIGFGADELVAKRRVQDLLTIGGKVFHQTHWAPLMEMQGSVAEVKLDIVHREGHSIPVLLSAIRRLHDGAVCDEIAVMAATDRQKYERELLLARKAAEHANAELAADHRRKDEFLATLAHELRGPLAPMRNVLEVLRNKDIADPELRWARGILDRQLAHISHLVEDLLEVSRITEGKVVLRRRTIRLGDAIEAAIEAAHPLVEAAGQQLDVTVADEPLWVDADLTRLTQVILNLLVNASKFTPPHGRIWLGCRAEGRSAVLSVRDAGIGIAAEQLPTIFKMFSQAEPALDRTKGGLGIGLALVRGLVELHGGTVAASSAGLNEGSEFVVRLPIVEAPRSTGMDADVEVAAQRTRSIVVVDDNADSAESLALLLAMEGHATRTAASGQAALRLVEESPADVVLLDLGLPGMSGFEVARRIRSGPEGESMLLVAVTGWGQQKDIDASMAAGFDHHLTKPVDYPALLAILATLDR
ncbi:MAG: ATP-binding protein [Caldimonas sp.]